MKQIKKGTGIKKILDVQMSQIVFFNPHVNSDEFSLNDDG